MLLFWQPALTADLCYLRQDLPDCVGSAIATPTSVQQSRIMISIMLVIDQCSISAAVCTASFSPGSIRKVNVVVLVVIMALPHTAFLLWIYCTV
jgi:hypothetical protein